MSEKKVELVFVLDRSGSMGGLESDTIGGFNGMVKKQKKQSGQAYVTTVLFDDDYELLHDREPLKDMKKLTEKEYFVRGCTALLDAMGKTITRVKKDQKKRKAYGEKHDVMFVIITDGMENASREYHAEQVKKMVDKMKRKHGWEFIFLGANIDAVAAASSVGISADHAANFQATSKGIRKNFQVVEAAMCSFRDYGSVAEDWKKELEE